MKFPLAVLDFEATSLSPQSYPIEVGVAIAFAPDEPLIVWSSLILPDRAWEKGDDWDPAAEQVHGITAVSLEKGERTSDVAEALNRLLGPIGHVYCDGGYYDGLWFEKLYQAAGITSTFALWELARLFVPDRPLFDRFSTILLQSEPPHKAGPDAERLCSALCQASSIRRTHIRTESVSLAENGHAILVQE